MQNLACCGAVAVITLDARPPSTQWATEPLSMAWRSTCFLFIEQPFWYTYHPDHCSTHFIDIGTDIAGSIVCTLAVPHGPTDIIAHLVLAEPGLVSLQGVSRGHGRTHSKPTRTRRPIMYMEQPKVV